MSTCGNCGTKLSCGCQKRTTADGKSACTNCVNKTQTTVKKQQQLQLLQLMYGVQIDTKIYTSF